jgi:hypothetical protein
MSAVASAPPGPAGLARLSTTSGTFQREAREVKVFWFFFSKKNTSSFSEEKEAKRLLFLVRRSATRKLDE